MRLRHFFPMFLPCASPRVMLLTLRGFESACFLLACMKPFVWASAESRHSAQAILQRITSAGLIGGPALSDCISGSARTQHGLNTQER